ncbi:hypothetical protein EYF80_029847 [Liparis tanakae]|uniref:Uncharacterized protein n=1 Tax=Liparis tanakae TaxID=230148 RepID=A0A4Z2H4C5_9TELE|nr:hypothetical protein EYF80_029847 [Liparis tanakae]
MEEVNGMSWMSLKSPAPQCEPTPLRQQPSMTTLLVFTLTCGNTAAAVEQKPMKRTTAQWETSEHTGAPAAQS